MQGDTNGNLRKPGQPMDVVETNPISLFVRLDTGCCVLHCCKGFRGDALLLPQPLQHLRQLAKILLHELFDKLQLLQLRIFVQRIADKVRVRGSANPAVATTARHAKNNDHHRTRPACGTFSKCWSPCPALAWLAAPPCPVPPHRELPWPPCLVPWHRELPWLWRGGLAR